MKYKYRNTELIVESDIELDSTIFMPYKESGPAKEEKPQVKASARKNVVRTKKK